MKSIKIENYGEIISKINYVLNFKGPVVYEVSCKEFHKYEPKVIGWETPIEDMYPYLNRKEFIKNLHIKPLDNWKKPFFTIGSEQERNNGIKMKIFQAMIFVINKKYSRC